MTDMDCVQQTNNENKLTEYAVWELLYHMCYYLLIIFPQQYTSAAPCSLKPLPF